MGHNCGSTCKRKTGIACATCRTAGHLRVALLDETGQPIKPDYKRPHATPHEKGAAVDMYFDGLSYRQTAENLHQYFGRETAHRSVYNWVREMTDRADAVTRPIRVRTGKTWVADEMKVKVGGAEYWLFNVMDADSRFVLAAYLAPERSAAAAQTALGMARTRAANAPDEVKTDTLESYQDAMPKALRGVKHTVVEGIRAEVNNNLSERLQGTFRGRNKTLRGLKDQDTGQEFLDGLVMHYNFFRPHDGLKGKRPAEAAGLRLPFRDWADVAVMEYGPVGGRSVSDEAGAAGDPPSNADAPGDGSRRQQDAG